MGETTVHFKRKNHNVRARIIIIIMVFIFIILVADCVIPKKTKKQDFVETEVVNEIEDKVLTKAILKAEADISKTVLEVKSTKAQRYVSEVCNEIEYITLTEDGSYTISHSRLGDKAGWWDKTFNESNIQVDFDYQAIFSIKTSDIFIYNTDGKVYIEYDTNDIAVKSIEVLNSTTKSKKDYFGKSYTNQEVLSLVDIAKDEINKQLNNDAELKTESSNNLNTYFTEFATKLEVDELVVNDQEVLDDTYTFINNGTIKYNHPNEGLGEVKYIVIHSTGVDNISAKQFYENLNASEQTREASAHFFVDSVNVVQLIATNLQAWHCGCDDPKIDCTNQNSIGVEICQFDNEVTQQRAIENTIKFVKDVLMKEFPNAILVMHRDVSKTLCPSILTDIQFEEYFK